MVLTFFSQGDMAMVKALGLLTLVLVIAVAVGSTVIGRSLGTQVPDSESALVMGGTCYRVYYDWDKYVCYGGNCSGGGCGCTNWNLYTIDNGYHKDYATPCV